MDKTFHELDPDGDVVLVLQSQDTTFAPWDESLANPPAPAFLPLSKTGKADYPSLFPEREFLRNERKGKGKKKRKKMLKNANQKRALMTDFGEPVSIELAPSAETESAVEAEPAHDDEATSAYDETGPAYDEAPTVDEYRSADEAHDTIEASPAVEPEPDNTGPVEQDQAVLPEEFTPREQTIDHSNISPLESPAFRHETPTTFTGDGPQEVQIRVSSKHLILASPYFKRMLKSGWKEEQTLSSAGCVSITADGDPDAMLILMNIIHGDTSRVPRLLSLEMLAKVAVLVDYYECFEAVNFFADSWVDRLRDSLTGPYSRDVILWIWVSWVFRKPEQFQDAISIGVKQSRGPICTLKLPIPARVIGKIDRLREQSISQVVALLHGVLEDLRGDRNTCSFECSSILLGALTKEMYARHLLPEPAPPFLGLSFTDIAKSIRNVRSPKWCNGRHYRSYCHNHHCNLRDLISPFIDSLEGSVTGFALGDVD